MVSSVRKTTREVCKLNTALRILLIRPASDLDIKLNIY